MKKGIILTLFVGMFAYLSASNQKAIDYYQSGDMKTAKALLTATSNADALDNYYIGLIQIKENNPEAAKASFEKGLQIDPENTYNKIGMATLLMPTDHKAAQKALKTLYKRNKKNVEVVTAIAEAFILNHDSKMADEYLQKAKKANKKSAVPYILEGAYYELAQRNNDAAVSYENALYFDPNSKIALVRLAKLYVGTRKAIAFDYLQKATTVDPNYEYGWKTQANLRYKNGFYPEAKVAQEKYMTLIKPTADDYQTYGEILYFNKDYDASLEALAKAPNNTVTNRLKMYSYYEQKKYEEAMPYAEYLMTNVPKEELITQDYSYCAEMRYKNKDYEAAGTAYEEAYKLDTTKISYLSDAGRAFDKAKKYDKAIELFNKSLERKEDISMADYYSLGSAYYSAGIDTIATPVAEDRTAHLMKADETYGKMIELFPEHYLGYIMRARVNSALDPKTTEGLAKPYYEQALQVMLPNEADYQNEIKEVYQYMGIYYLQTDQYLESKPYWEKVLEIDPDNSIAKQVIKSLESRKK